MNKYCVHATTTKNVIVEVIAPDEKTAREMGKEAFERFEGITPVQTPRVVIDRVELLHDDLDHKEG